jgi:PAS domain S-box-containing protein
MPRHMELRLRSREGQWRWMQARAIPMQAASGEVVRFLWICTDIDDRKRVDIERKRAEEYHSRLAAIVESSQDAIVSKDLNGIITSWNEGATLLYGYTPDEIIGRSKSLLIPPDRQEELAMILERVRTGDHIKPYETVRLRKDGSRVDVSLSVSPVVDAGGQVTGASTIERSITDRLQAEAETAQHLAEIETLNVQLRRAMTETHHRVRNSLQIISALVDLEAPEPDASVGVEQFLRIGGHVRALAAVHDLLTEQAKLDSTASDLSARDLLRKLVELIRLMAGDRRIEAQVEEARLSIQQGSSLAVITHELMTNAVRYGRSVVEVRFHVRGDSATLEVLDDGPGFPVGFDPVESGNTGLELISQIAVWDLRASEVRFGAQPQGGGLVTLSFPLTHTPRQNDSSQL